jgi:hypothetical protein
MAITNPQMTAKQQRAAERRLKAEMLAELKRDWADLWSPTSTLRRDLARRNARW